MNQTNTDYLFQVIAPSADRATSGARGGEDSPGFSDHLSYAATSVFDVLHQPSRIEQTKQTQRRDDTASESLRERDSDQRQDQSPSATASGPSCASGSASASSAVNDTCDDAVSDRATDGDRADDDRSEDAGG